MSSFYFNTVLPFAATVDYNRLINGLVVVILFPLLLLAGFSAIMSDFGNSIQTGSAKPDNDFLSKNLSVCNVNQNCSLSPDGGFAAGNFIGKGMILFPVIPGEEIIGCSSGSDCANGKVVISDSTIYRSPDLVDKAPELIWMIYPDLSKSDIAATKSVQVLMSVLVDYNGQTLDVTIADESKMSGSAKQIVLESVRSSLFKPAQKNKRSVRCWVQVPLELKV